MILMKFYLMLRMLMFCKLNDALLFTLNGAEILYAGVDNLTNNNGLCGVY